MGLQKDIHIDASQYSWVGSIFYVGYLAFLYPHNLMMQRFPIAKYLAAFVTIWGIALCCLAAVQSYASIMVVRTILGACEGSVTCGFVLITAIWYKKTEHASRTAFWYSANGIAIIIGGLIAYAAARGVQVHRTSFAGWRILFLVLGILSIIIGIMMYICLPDTPVSARFFSETDKGYAVERLRGNHQGVGNRVFKRYQFIEALTDIRVRL
jgi:ACS family allantoate permease-like MFS transporter